ncbi:tryptophan synthase subunit alpha [Gayadomonas joobiniege]|uniref:tryptophan synthase subunit alpha n=1 Tax=Gayadomonas joobiniege TaxID=1234606 RepID=UPI000368D8BF|nr:tryptophan synthase subunit alpha [Gayadomonas joobiniege]
MSNRYQTLFSQLKEKKQGAFVPFVTLGDPDLESSFNIVKALIDGGADALELGIPYSDPIADGPTIQKANIRALEAGVKPKHCFELLSKIRAYNSEIPIGLLLYSNLVFARGIDNFYKLCADIGVDSVLVADVPARESALFRQAAAAHQVDAIFIAPPNGTDASLKRVAEYGTGYTYLLSRAGVTGTETEAAMPVERIVAKLKEYNAPPTLLGFGISKPEHVKAAIQAGASGAISGSAVVKLIENNLADPTKAAQEIESFVKQMKAATQD